MKCDLFNVRGVQSGYHKIFNICWFLFIFFRKWQRLCKLLYLINCNYAKKLFLIFLMKRHYYTLKLLVYIALAKNRWEIKFGEYKSDRKLWLVTICWGCSISFFYLWLCDSSDSEKGTFLYENNWNYNT